MSDRTVENPLDPSPATLQAIDAMAQRLWEAEGKPDGGPAQERGATAGGRGRRVRRGPRVQDQPADRPAHQGPDTGLVGSAPAITPCAADTGHKALKKDRHLSLKVTVKDVQCRWIND